MDPQRENTFVLDTCVLLNDPEIFDKLGHGQIVIPTAVIKELDCMKRNPDPEDTRAKAARKVSRTLDMLGTQQDISSGAKTPSGSIVRITHRHERIDDLASNADNRIVGTALMMKNEGSENVILLSSDNNVRNITRSYGIRATDYPSHRTRPARRAQGTTAFWHFVAAVMALILFIFYVTR